MSSCSPGTRLSCRSLRIPSALLLLLATLPIGAEARSRVRITPGISVTTLYDTNTFNSARNEKSDVSTVVEMR